VALQDHLVVELVMKEVEVALLPDSRNLLSWAVYAANIYRVGQKSKPLL